MKPIRAILPLLLALAGPSLHAASGSWNVSSGGDWSNSASWTPGVADGAGNTATFGNVITAASTINLDGPRTIGNITASDTGQDYTLSGANLLTLDVASGKPVIDVITNRTLTIGSVIEGNDGLQKNGAGTLKLNAISDSFSGNITINDGTLRVGDNNTAARLGGATYAGDILNNGTLWFTHNQNQELSGIISGSGVLNKGGQGTLTLSGANTYTGKTIIAGSGAGGPSLSIASFNSVNGGTPLMESSSLGAPTTVADGTIQLGSGGNIRSCTLIYTGAGETTDRVMDLNFNSSAKHTLNNSGTGLLRFTSPFTINPSSGSTGGGFNLRGTGSGEIAEMGTIPGIIEKLDAGTWTILNAVNTTPTAATVKVTAGSLVLRKGSFGHTGITSVAANAALIHYASTDAPLLIPGPLAITGGTSTTIGASIGSTVDSARIEAAGDATATASVKVDLYGNLFSTVSDGSGEYMLIQGGGTNTLGNATWSLGTVFNATQFTVGAINQSADTVTVDITQVPALATAYWRGTATAGLTKVWAASNGSNDSNWSATAGGALQPLVPGPTTDVIIPSLSPAVTPVGTTLGADLSIHGLTISDTTNGLGLAASVKDSYSLTLGVGGLTMDASVPASLIAVPVVVAGDQTWSNSSANALTLSGPVSGDGDITKTGTGSVHLTGRHTFTGNVTVDEGSLALSNPALAPHAVLTVAAGAALQLNYTGTASVSYLIVNGTALPAGVYNSANTSPYLTGTGSITVTVTDTDVDGIPDSWTQQYFDHPTGQEGDLSRAGDDADIDGLDNLGEYQQGTNPKVADTDIDGLNDGPEVFTHLTNPLVADTDGDGLTDGAEVNTHTTNPLLADTDADGLTDGAEINTHATNPLTGDTDGDDAGDWYELTATFTDPKLSSSKPNVIYPLPKPDNTPTAADKPVKVFVLLGQSNMQGKGTINPIGTPGTLATVVKSLNKFPNLLDTNGNFSTRGDVQYRGVISCIGDADLAVGQGTSATLIGPELSFGHLMGHHFDEPVIVIKASYGGQSLGFDFLPPGSQRYTTGGYTYAGYLDTVWRWVEGTAPPPQHVPGTPISYLANQPNKTENYAGKMFDDCVSQVNGILGNFANEYSEYSAQGYEIAGIGWFQGWNDSVSTSYPERYQQNMANFINVFRSAISAPEAPFVIAGCAFSGWAAAGGQLNVINSQLAMNDTNLYPSFAGNVKTMECRGYWRETADSPANEGYHYNRNSETYLLVGDALARGMIDLLPSGNASAYATWASTNAPTGDPDDDFDGDGVSNAVEFVLGGDKNTKDLGKLPVTATNGNDMTFTFKRDQTSINPAMPLMIQVGSNLATWPDSYIVPDGAAANSPGVTVVKDSPPGFDNVTLTIPKGLDAKKFARLKVVIAP